MAGQQPLLWSITEHHFHPAPSRADKSTRPSSPHSDTSEDVSGYYAYDGEDEHGDAEWMQTSLKGGSALNAYFPLGSQIIPFDREGVVVTAPKQPSVYYKTWNGAEWDDAKDHFAFERKDPGAEDMVVDEDRTPKRGPYDPTDDSNEDEWDQELNDILLTGGVSIHSLRHVLRCRAILTASFGMQSPEPHRPSIWGTFKLMGRIRSWDGMIIILKEFVRFLNLVFDIVLCSDRISLLGRPNG